MTFEATFRHGSPTMIDHTTGSTAISAGEIVTGVDGGLEALIAHSDIPANTLGALAAQGGVYDIPVLAADPAYTEMFWDDTNGTAVNTGTYKLGYLVEAAAGSNANAKILHSPK